MSGSEIRREEVVKRYSNVLFDLAQESKDLKIILKDVERLWQYLKEEPLVWSQVASPLISLQAQRRIIKSLVFSLKLGDLVSRFLIVLCQNRRLQNLRFILEEFIAQARVAEGILEGTLETAVELSQKDIEALQKALKTQVGQNFSLRQEVKENLLGGVVLRMGSLIIDASLRTRLNGFREVMKG